VGVEVIPAGVVVAKTHTHSALFEAGHGEGRRELPAGLGRVCPVGDKGGAAADKLGGGDDAIPL